MSGLLGGFVRMMKQRCAWTKRSGIDEYGVVQWGDSSEIPCIFFASKRVIEERTGDSIITPASFYVRVEYGVSIGDKIEFRGRTYIVEEIKDIDWFGGVHDGYKCLCRQEGGVAA
jgi:hypothetical protein